MKTKTIDKVILSAVFAGVMGVTALFGKACVSEEEKAYTRKIEQAHKQTMQELYEPVGNGGALHAMSTFQRFIDEHPKGISQKHISFFRSYFGVLARINEDYGGSQRRTEMYQKMDDYCWKLIY